MSKASRLASFAVIALGLTACSPSETVATPSAGASVQVTGTLFVANKRGNTLSKIDLVSGEEVLRRDSCTNPHELATSPDGKHVALACYGGTTVDIFQTEDLSKVASIDLGEKARPHGIVWHANGDIYSTAEGRQSIFWIREPLGRQQTFEYSTGKQGSHMLVVNPSATVAWTTDLGSKTATRVALKARIAPLSVTVGEEPEGIAMSPDGKSLWVSARGSNEAFELDPETMTVRNTLATGAFPLRIAIRPQGDVAVTSDLADGGLTVIDIKTAKVLRSIAVSSPQDARDRFQVTILWSDDGRRVYVAETASDTVAEVDYVTGKVLRRLKTGQGGDGMAILP